MSERIFANEPASSLAAQTSGVSPLSDSKLLARQIADDLGGIAPAIILAIATYPVVLAIGAAIVVIFVSGRTNYGWVEELEGIISYALIATMIGLYWTSIVAFATLICVYFFLRSFGLHVSCVRLGAFCGGLVGFVAVMPLIFLAALEAGLRE